jgi:hypothetical protein
MSAGPPRSSRWKRRILRILVVLALAPLVLLLLGNLALATPWARGWLAQRISLRSGTEVSVGRLGFTPWGGLVIGDLRLRQPPALRAAIDRPLLAVRAIRIVPRWERVRQGKLEIAAIHIEGPRAVVAIEMLASLASAGAARPAPTTLPTTLPPALAVVPAPPAAAGEGRPPAVVMAPRPERAARPLDSSTVDWPDTAWIEITDARLQLRSAGILCELSGLEARVPVAGKAASSTITLARCDLFGRTVATGLSLPLAWNPPELRAGPSDLMIAGLQVKLAAVVGRSSGMPFAVQVIVPPQPLAAAGLFKDRQPAAARVEARLQGGGLLRFPASWQGLAAAEADRPALAFAGEMRRFEEARATVALQGGVLHCPEARLISDRLSLLGNGRVGGGGLGEAVLRVVVPPAAAADLARRLTRPGMAAGPLFKPLETPDRLFLDLRWTSSPGGQGVELGEGGPVMPAGDLGRLVLPQAAAAQREHPGG